MKLPESARPLVESDSLAHLVTLNADGSAHVTCIWVGLDGDEIVSAHLGDQRKLRNVVRDPRVALSIEGTEVAAAGLKQYLVVHGRARASSKVAHPSCYSGLPTSTWAPRSSSRRWTTRPPGSRDAHHGRTHRRRRTVGGLPHRSDTPAFVLPMGDISYSNRRRNAGLRRKA